MRIIEFTLSGHGAKSGHGGGTGNGCPPYATAPTSDIFRRQCVPFYFILHSVEEIRISSLLFIFTFSNIRSSIPQLVLLCRKKTEFARNIQLQVIHWSLYLPGNPVKELFHGKPVAKIIL